MKLATTWKLEGKKLEVCEGFKIFHKRFDHSFRRIQSFSHLWKKRFYVVLRDKKSCCQVHFLSSGQWAVGSSLNSTLVSILFLKRGDSSYSTHLYVAPHPPQCYTQKRYSLLLQKTQNTLNQVVAFQGKLKKEGRTKNYNKRNQLWVSGDTF